MKNGEDFDAIGEALVEDSVVALNEIAQSGKSCNWRARE